MTIKQQTAEILKVSRKARNSDKWLEIIYMQKFGLELTPAQAELFMQMPDLQVVTRERRRFQEAGMYRADPEVEQARFDKFKEEKDSAQSKKPKYISEAPEEVREDVLTKMGYKSENQT